MYLFGFFDFSNKVVLDINNVRSEILISYTLMNGGTG